MKRILCLLLVFAAAFGALATPVTFTSPDGRLKATIESGAHLTWSLERDGEVLVEPSEIGVTLQDGTVWGPGTRFRAAKKRSVSEEFGARLFKRNVVKDCYNEITLPAKGFSVVFRLYNDGFAYRFVPEKPVTVKGESACFSFPRDWNAYIPYVSQHTETLESQFMSSFESRYTVSPVSAWDPKRLAFAPVTIAAGGVKLCIAEADLRNYPGLFLYNGNGSRTLKGVFAPVPSREVQGGHNNLQSIVTATEPYIAKDTQTLPWRTVIVAAEDRELAQSDMVYRLAKPAEPVDWSWVRPGKVAWDWWNNWNIYGVDFESGINNDTYKYYIDFASAKGIEFVILDEGWAVNGQADLMQVVPEIDVRMLADYARSKGVGLILWAGYKAVDKDIEGVFKHYSKMGIKGFKVDFMDRDDQLVMQFYENVAKTAAKYHLLIDFHGAFKPSGLERTYPNIINYEGVAGLEQMKWGAKACDQVTYDVTIPFVRMAAGRMDYTQGAMINCTKGNASSNNSTPMSQGTRCHQLAEYVVFDSPLAMLCDSPSRYLAEPGYTSFLSGIPTVWDETAPLAGKIGEYVAIARRKGSDWYVGVLNGWEAREVELDLGFIQGGGMTVFQDGVNAALAAQDYKTVSTTLPSDGKITVRMAPGGGWVAKITR